MKKLILITVLAIFSLSVSSCKDTQEEEKTILETYQVAKNHDNHFGLFGDTERQSRFKTYTEILKDKYREQYPLVDSLKVRTGKPCSIKVTNDKGKKVVGLKVNDVEVPFSNSILNKGDAIFGDGSSFVRSEQSEKFQKGEGICYIQLAKFEQEFLRVVKNITLVDKTREIPNPNYINPEKESTSSFAVPVWLQNAWNWILGTLFPLLGLLLLLFLAGAILYWLFPLRKKDQTNQTSTTISKTHCDKCFNNTINCICCLPYCDNATTQMREARKIAAILKDGETMSIIGPGKKPFEVHIGNSYPITTRGAKFTQEDIPKFKTKEEMEKFSKAYSRNEMINTTVINIMGNNKKAKEVIIEFQENIIFKDFDQEKIKKFVKKIKKDTTKKE